jgi:DNA polymerase-4
MNNFYASVECLYDPALRDVPMAVGGDPELRHGIVLAKNTIAKQCGVKTGQALWEARQRCPGIVFVPPDYPKYLHFSQMAREIYETYTDRVEPFGPDECWLDVTGSANLFGTGRSIADSLRARVKAEMGVTLSVGVSFNKVFAKLGSDMKKPDATTEIGLDDFREKVWPLPVSELLYIGSATRRKLNQYHIGTIGALAQTDAAYLSHWFGKVGTMLWRFANGLVSSPVSAADAVPLIKSIGNSTTTPRDLVCDEDVKITLFVLAESVAARLREAGFLCRTVQLTVRDNQLNVLQRQEQLPSPACASSLLADAALRLFRETFPAAAMLSAPSACAPAA